MLIKENFEITCKHTTLVLGGQRANDVETTTAAGVQDAHSRPLLLLLLHQPHLLQQMDPHGESRAPRCKAK